MNAPTTLKRTIIFTSPKQLHCPSKPTHLKPVVRLRCQFILLKAQGRTAPDIGSIVGMCELSMHHWIDRYRTEGISGMLTRKGQGRKPLLNPQADAPAVILSVKAHRQSVRAVQAAYEANGGKRVSEDCFRAFLKASATPISESESGWVKVG